MREIKRIAIAGAGTMGASIAQAFAKFSYGVKLYDVFPAALEKAKQMITWNQQSEVAAGNLTEAESTVLQDRISFTADPRDLADTDFLVEAILENLEIKHKFYRQISEIVPKDAILCSNTSGLSITAIAEAVENPERFVGMHWMNPPHIIPLIEVIRGGKDQRRIRRDRAAGGRGLRQTPRGHQGRAQFRFEPFAAGDPAGESTYRAGGHRLSRGGGRRDEVRSGLPLRLLRPL